jgi:serine/threonine protein kinase
MSLGNEASTAWISSSGSENSGDDDSIVIAITPHSRITAHQHPHAIARKSLLPGHRAPHNPLRELAIHQLLMEKYLSEVEITERNVIPLLSYEVFPNGRIWLEFPLMQTDLKEIYRDRKEEIAKDMELRTLLMRRFLEVISALEWVHEQGVIHRDVNPSNILLSYNLEAPAFLADFGISWVKDFPDDPDEDISKYSSGVGTGYHLLRAT